MDVTQRGETITVKVNGRTFKVTYSTPRRRLQIREDGRLIREAFTFQEALNIVDALGELQYAE